MACGTSVTWLRYNDAKERGTTTMRKGLLKGLTEEQIARIKNCHSSAEFLELAKEEGIQLTDEQLSAISGGGCSGEDEKGPINNPF